MADVLTDAKAFTFSPGGVRLDLSGNLVSWNDKIGIRLAGHQYLKRDGAEQEPMGAEPGRFTMRLCFLGPKWASNYRALVAAIRKDPRGEMVHPVLGSLRVACEGIPDAVVDPGAERDSINFSLSFVEDSVDASSESARYEGPATKAAKVNNLATQVTAAIAQFATAIAAGETLTGEAVAYAADAVAATTANTFNSGVDQQLASVSIAADEAIAAIIADPDALGAAGFPAISLVRQLLAACLDLEESTRSTRATVISYVVGADTNLAALAATLYGKDALQHLDELLALNRIPSPHAVPAGTRLRVSAPTLTLR